MAQSATELCLQATLQGDENVQVEDFCKNSLAVQRSASP